MPLYLVTMILNLTVGAIVSTRRLVPFLLAAEIQNQDGPGQIEDSSTQTPVHTPTSNGCVEVRISQIIGFLNWFVQRSSFILLCVNWGQK